MDEINYLKWLDSALVPEWTHAPNEYTGLSEIVTIGYLIFEDGQHVQVAKVYVKNVKNTARFNLYPKRLFWRDRYCPSRIMW